MVSEGAHLRKVLWNLVAFASSSILCCLWTRNVLHSRFLLEDWAQMCPPWESVPWPLPTSPHQGPLLSAPTVPVKPPSTYCGGKNHCAKLPFNSSWEYDGVVWLALSLPKLRGSTMMWKDWQPLLAICFISLLPLLRGSQKWSYLLFYQARTLHFFSLVCRSSEWDVSGIVVLDFEKGY